MGICAQKRAKEIEADLQQFALHLDTNPDLAFYHISKAYCASIVLENDSLHARSSCNLGYYHYTKNNLTESKKKCFEAISYAKKAGFHKILASSYNQLGLIALDEDSFDVALRHYLLALKITERLHLPEIKSRILINLGYLHLIQKDTVKAIGYYNQNINNAEENLLNKELAIGYETVATLHSASDPEKAASLYNKALAIVRKNKDLYTEFRLYIDLSDLYLNTAGEESDEKVYYYLQKALSIQKILRDESMLFYIYFNLGSYYVNQKENDRSLEYYYKSLALSNKNIPSGQVLNLYKVLSAAFILKHDYKNALLYKERYNSLRDSLFDIDKNKVFNEIQTRYDVDKKNLKIKLLTKEREIQRNKKKAIFFIGLILMVLLVSSLLWLRHRIKTQRLLRINETKLLRHKFVTLKQEQELKRMKNVLEGQELERNRLSKEIHDGIGGSLAGIKLQLSQVNATLKNEKINDIEQKMSIAFGELRSISHNLSFNFMIDKNLDHLFYQLKTDYESREEFKLEVVIFPENALTGISEEIKHQVYRIVQELLANVAKHAKAEQVMLSLTRYDEILNIIIEDDGVGFETGNTEGIGIKNIKSRILSLNGTIAIDTNVGNGTSVLIDIPINQTL
jgi:signal transduction histidine kinase